MNITTSDVTPPAGREPVNKSGGDRGSRTGKPKTIVQRDYIREHKYEDTMGCLLMLDEGDESKRMWLEACERDLGFVHRCLADLVETDEAWAKLLNPVGALVKKLLPHIQGLRRRRSR